MPAAQPPHRRRRGCGYRRWCWIVLVLALTACATPAVTPTAGSVSGAASPATTRAGTAAWPSASPGVSPPGPPARPSTTAVASPPGPAARATGTTAASATPASPQIDGPPHLAPLGSPCDAMLHFRGRSYKAFYSQECALGAKLRPAPYQPDRIVGATFAWWQTDGFFPAGTPIYSVAGQPSDKLLAIKQLEGTPFEEILVFGAQSYTPLRAMQVVQATVVRVDAPPRLLTAGGPPPAPGAHGNPPALVITSLAVTVQRPLRGAIAPGNHEIAVWELSAPVDDPPAPYGNLTPPVPLAPGDVVLLFLYPVSADLAESLDGERTAPTFLALPYWIALLRDGQVVPGGWWGAAWPATTLADFLARVDETFAGLQPLPLPAAGAGTQPTSALVPRQSPTAR